MKSPRLFEQNLNAETQFKFTFHDSNLTNSLFGKIENSALHPPLKEILIAYLHYPSPDNFTNLRAEVAALIAIRNTLLNSGRYPESQATLGSLSIIAEVVSKIGTTEQQFSINLLSLAQDALKELRDLGEKLSLDDLIQITIKWDEWLLSSLPNYFQVKSHTNHRPESLCSLLSCLLIKEFVSKNSQFNSMVNDMRLAAINLLQSKGKRFYLKAWLDEIFFKTSGFDWTLHRKAQDTHWGYHFSFKEIHALFDFDTALLVELKDIATLEHHLELLKEVDYLKKNDEKNIDVILVEMEALADTLGERTVPTENQYWQERIMNALMFYSGILYTLMNPIWNIGAKQQETTRQRVIKKIKDLELNLLIGTHARQQERHSWKNDSRYLKRLETFRKKSKTTLLSLLSEEVDTDKKRLLRAEKLDVFSKEIANFLKDFMSRLIDASIADLGPAPCTYAFIGFGSLEKNAMTPYSDLEFGILIEHDSAENRQYFRNLSYILQAKVIQLGESPIPQSLFDYSFDHLTNCGFCFDLGGKISLGRSYSEHESQDPDKKYGQLKYELIGTPSQMIRYIEDDYFVIDRLLPVELCQCTRIAGSNELTEQYHALLSVRLNQLDQKGELFCQRRAMTYLQGNSYLRGDLEVYASKLEGSNDGQLYDVKKDIYRLTDRLISDLALFFGLAGGSTLQKINQLLTKKVITAENAVHLKIIDGIAKEIRLSTYFYYGRQQESLSILPLLFKDNSLLFRLNNRNAIERFYHSAYPFQEQMKVFSETWLCNQTKSALTTLKMPIFFDAGLTTKMKIARRLGEHDKVQALLAKMQHKNPRSQGLMVLEELGKSYFYSGNAEKSVEYLSKALKIKENDLDHNHIELAGTLLNLGTSYGILGQIDERVKLQQRALNILEQHYGPDHPDVAVALAALGTAYGFLGNMTELLKLQQRALEIQERTYGENHTEVAATLVNMGNAYGALGDRQKQVIVQERALAIQIRAYGPDHVNLSVVLFNLGTAYGILGDKQKQVNLQERALALRESAYGMNHISLIMILENLADAYWALAKVQKRLSLLERIMSIKRGIYKPNHLETAKTLVTWGNAVRDSGDPKTAVKLQTQALAIQEAHYGPDHFEVAMTLVALGTQYAALGDRHQQVSLQQRALKIQEQYYSHKTSELAATLVALGNGLGALGDSKTQVTLQTRALTILEGILGSDHVDIAVTLMNLSNAYGDLGQYQQQRKLQERALAIKERNYGLHHPEVAAVLTNLGNCYGHLENPSKQQSLQERSLEILEHCRGPNHPDVAITLCNLGNAYGALGNLQKQVSVQQRALAIQEALFGQQHIRITNSLVCLGIAYGALGNYEKQVELQERALAIQEQTHSANHPEVACTLLNLGTAYGHLGDKQKQVALHERALAIQEPLFGLQHPVVRITVQALSAGYGALGDYSSQIALLGRTLATKQQRARPQLPNFTFNWAPTTPAATLENPDAVEDADAKIPLNKHGI